MFKSLCIYTERLLSLSLLSNYICIRMERIHLACWEIKYLDKSESEALCHLRLQCSLQEMKSISVYECCVREGKKRTGQLDQQNATDTPNGANP